MESGPDQAEAQHHLPEPGDELPIPISLSPCLPVSLSSSRAWFYLIWLSLQRQARARHMVWIAVSLLGLTVIAIAENTARGRWSMDHWRSPRGSGPSFGQWLDDWTALTSQATATDPLSSGVGTAV